MKKFRTDTFHNTICYNYLNSPILSAIRGTPYYGVDDGNDTNPIPRWHYTPRTRSNHACGCRNTKYCDELRENLWKASTKSAIYVPDTATAWFQEQRKLKQMADYLNSMTPEEAYAYQRHLCKGTSRYSSPPVQCLGVKQPLRVVQSCPLATNARRISPEFLKLLQDHDCRMQQLIQASYNEHRPGGIDDQTERACTSGHRLDRSSRLSSTRSQSSSKRPSKRPNCSCDICYCPDKVDNNVGDGCYPCGYGSQVQEHNIASSDKLSPKEDDKRESQDPAYRPRVHGTTEYVRAIREYSAPDDTQSKKKTTNSSPELEDRIKQPDRKPPANIEPTTKKSTSTGTVPKKKESLREIWIKPDATQMRESTTSLRPRVPHHRKTPKQTKKMDQKRISRTSLHPRIRRHKYPQHMTISKKPKRLSDRSAEPSVTPYKESQHTPTPKKQSSTSGTTSKHIDSSERIDVKDSKKRKEPSRELRREHTPTPKKRESPLSGTTIKYIDSSERIDVKDTKKRKEPRRELRREHTPTPKKRESPISGDASKHVDSSERSDVKYSRKRKQPRRESITELRKEARKEPRTKKQPPKIPPKSNKGYVLGQPHHEKQYTYTPPYRSSENYFEKPKEFKHKSKKRSSTTAPPLLTLREAKARKRTLSPISKEFFVRSRDSSERQSQPKATKPPPKKRKRKSQPLNSSSSAFFPHTTTPTKTAVSNISKESPKKHSRPLVKRRPAPPKSKTSLPNKTSTSSITRDSRTGKPRVIVHPKEKKAGVRSIYEKESSQIEPRVNKLTMSVQKLSNAHIHNSKSKGTKLSIVDRVPRYKQRIEAPPEPRQNRAQRYSILSYSEQNNPLLYTPKGSKRSSLYDEDKEEDDDDDDEDEAVTKEPIRPTSKVIPSVRDYDIRQNKKKQSKGPKQKRPSSTIMYYPKNQRRSSSKDSFEKRRSSEIEYTGRDSKRTPSEPFTFAVMSKRKPNYGLFNTDDEDDDSDENLKESGNAKNKKGKSKFDPKEQLTTTEGKPTQVKRLHSEIKKGEMPEEEKHQPTATKAKKSSNNAKKKDKNIKRNEEKYKPRSSLHKPQRKSASKKVRARPSSSVPSREYNSDNSMVNARKKSSTKQKRSSKKQSITRTTVNDFWSPRASSFNSYAGYAGNSYDSFDSRGGLFGYESEQSDIAKKQRTDDLAEQSTSKAAIKRWSTLPHPKSRRRSSSACKKPCNMQTQTLHTCQPQYCQYARSSCYKNSPISSILVRHRDSYDWNNMSINYPARYQAAATRTQHDLVEWKKKQRITWANASDYGMTDLCNSANVCQRRKTTPVLTRSSQCSYGDTSDSECCIRHR